MNRTEDKRIRGVRTILSGVWPKVHGWLGKPEAGNGARSDIRLFDESGVDIRHWAFGSMLLPDFLSAGSRWRAVRH